jgi:hypothetical protein
MNQTRKMIGDWSLYQWLTIASVVPLLLLSTSACEASQVETGGAKADQDSAPIRQVSDTQPGKTVTDKHVPISQQYRTLDEYLAYLERMQAPVDGPWYKQVRPGIYELQTGNLRVLGAEEGKRTFTREELERQFGFRK